MTTLATLILAVMLGLCASFSEVSANPEETKEQGSRWQYALLVLPGGEGQIDYLLIQIASRDSVLEGRAYFLSYFHDSLSYDELTLKDVIQRLRKRSRRGSTSGQLRATSRKPLSNGRSTKIIGSEAVTFLTATPRKLRC
jgi:hypothetical protein